MSQDPFPGSGQDGQEPGGSRSLPGSQGGSSYPEDDRDPEASMDSLAAAVSAGRYEVPPQDPGGDAAGAGQGLFVCLPPEQLSLAGFAQGGAADTMTPGPLLAAVVDAITGQDAGGLAALSDDQLVGVISAARRLECRAAWTQLAAIAAFAARRQDHHAPDQGTPDQGTPDQGTENQGTQGTQGPRRPGRGDPIEFAADELASELHLTWASAAAQISYACAVATRVPRSFAALAAGELHPVHLRIIEDETRYLSAGDAATADEILAGMAGSKTFAQLRYAAHRLVLKLDPEAAQRRKDAARQEAHVRRFREDSGNAGMIARELPSDEVLASWQHIEQRALDLRAAGLPGTLRELRVRAYLDLLQERDSRPTQPGPQERDGGGGQTDPPAPDSGPPGTPRTCDTSAHPAPPGRKDPGPSIAALVTITAPLDTLLDRSGIPGEAGGFGLLDAQDTRDLVAAAARHPATRWCLTALHPDGTAAAHACVPGRHQVTPAQASLAATGDSRSGPDPPPMSRDPASAVLRTLRARLALIARGGCDHRHAETGYQPSRTLAHLVSARSAKCTAPGCGRPAARCDQDHTVAWHKGGATCQCNLAPLCRHHHRCKQAEGWRLEQPEPGVLKWQTPAGRTYSTTPTVYPV